ncbi:hypothetical protein DH2020_039191 [Rehmannia glutinosa]|uniref:Uncharacterized protein n=1 Tax=Rehmannia glutinosa TaxID=99300 RepID=A0ABR0UWR6_REHGL
MDEITNFQNLHKTKPPKEEEEEETISLCDFPLNSDEPEKIKDSYKAQDKRRSTSEPSDFFEFFNNDITISEMSLAEDIIFCGKLVPYKNQHQFLKSLSADDATHFSRRNRHSFPELINPTIRSNTLTSAPPPRSNFRSIDGKMLRRRRNSNMLVKSEAADIRRSSSKSSARSESSKAVSKSRWFVLMFGPLKLKHQQEMDLREIKSRQIRRNQRSFFPSVDAGGEIPGSRSERRSFWGGLDLLKVLSCRSHASVAVTASVGFVQRF